MCHARPGGKGDGSVTALVFNHHFHQLRPLEQQCLRPGSSHNKYVFLSALGAGESKTNVLADSASAESPPPGSLLPSHGGKGARLLSGVSFIGAQI